MNSPEFKDAVCRICLDENVALDWNTTLADHCDVTYKDCYYKYTQLKPLDVDHFSSKLCQNCIYSLENAHELILKALDSYNFLQEVNCMNSEMDDSTITEDDKNFISTAFETILVEKTDTESLIEDQFEYQNLDESFDNDSNYKRRTHSSSVTQLEESFFIENEHEEECDIDQALQLDDTRGDNVSKTMKICRKRDISARSKLVKDDTKYIKENVNKKQKTVHNTHLRPENGLGIKSMITKVKGRSKSKRRRGKIISENSPSMCSFCSKILHNKYSLQKHEKIHTANRERKATCPICGVKFFEEAYVKSHMQIHNANRVKKHKCEFCDKAFFEKGGLNVHRRIHLGQMVPCTLCSKEFFRQVDLDIHMNSHSAILINAETKKRSRYWVRCKYCDKNVSSTSFKSHTAIHLNEPLMKCSICNKEFFRRDSCTQHLKSIHQKTTEEYNDFIILYNKNRLSHLYLEQTAEIQPKED